MHVRTGVLLIRLCQFGNSQKSLPGSSREFPDFSGKLEQGTGKNRNFGAKTLTQFLV